MLQQQQVELEMKNAAIALEMEQEELRSRARAKMLRDEEEHERARAERQREEEEDQHEQEIDRQLARLQQPVSGKDVQDSAQELMSNDQLIAELTMLKRAISTSSSLNSTDDELLAMFSQLQVLQDILEKRDVEIDAAQMLARTFRRQSGQDVGPGQKLRRRSSVEKPPGRQSFSRHDSLENKQAGSRRGSIEYRKSLSRQSSGGTDRAVGRQDSLESNFSMINVEDDDAAYRGSIDAVYGREDEGDKDDEDEVNYVETDPRVLKLQQQISLLSSNILSKSFTDKTLLSMFDQLEGLKRQLAALKGIEMPDEVTMEDSV
jgi:hypothetical protein